MIHKSIANKVLSNLDSAANRLEQLAKQGKISSRVATSLIRDLDGFADRFEVTAFGKDSFKRRVSTWMSGDKDESQYMTTFDNTVKPLKVDADEPYMHTTGPSARWSDGIGTYDVDRSSTVMSRPEYNVVGQSEFSNGGKTVAQPSWPGAGKNHKASTKQWAD